MTTSWVGVLLGSIPGYLLFLTYVSDSPNNLNREHSLFADETSLFFVAYDFNTSASHINNDLKLRNDWVLKQKMSFNPGLSKQAQ